MADVSRDSRRRLLTLRTWKLKDRANYAVVHAQKAAETAAFKADIAAARLQPVANETVPFTDCSQHLRYDTRCYFNLCSKADMSQLNLPHVTND